MTITARVSCTKDATYMKTSPGKPAQQLTRQIGRYYEVTGSSMGAIQTQVTAIKAYLEKNLTVETVYPTIPKDETVTEWKEQPWVVSW